MVARTYIPYAPYIMKLIKENLIEQTFDDSDCVEHKVKVPYVKTVKTTQPIASDSFMADARASGDAPAGSYPRRKSHAASTIREVKKLTSRKHAFCSELTLAFVPVRPRTGTNGRHSSWFECPGPRKPLVPVRTKLLVPVRGWNRD